MKLEGAKFVIPGLHEDRNIINEAKEGANAYDVLYHCTSIDGLKAIIDSNSFWLSNLRCVNDKEEANRITISQLDRV